jgi:hypothetical protein
MDDIAISKEDLRAFLSAHRACNRWANKLVQIAPATGADLWARLDFSAQNWFLAFVINCPQWWLVPKDWPRVRALLLGESWP